MKTIILTSAGMQIKDEILQLLPAPPELLELAHIITASKVEEDKGYLDNEKVLLKKAGFKVTEYDLDGKNEQEVREDLSNFDVIYVQGGNTFYLLDSMHKCNFTSVIRELLDSGAIYIGVSAGSIVAGPDIAVASWKGVDIIPDEDVAGSEDWTGLYLVPFAVFPHFTGSLPESVGREVMKAPYDVKYLRDDQGILVRDDGAEMFGGK